VDDHADVPTVNDVRPEDAPEANDVSNGDEHDGWLLKFLARGLGSPWLDHRTGTHFSIAETAALAAAISHPEEHFMSAWAAQKNGPL
jgi:hypothetical protein